MKCSTRGNDQNQSSDPKPNWPRHGSKNSNAILARSRFSATHLSPYLQWGAILLLALLTVGCADWNEFGGAPTNPHSTSVPGPGASAITTQMNLVAAGGSGNHGHEVGVLTDSSGDYYVTSLASDIHVYDRFGTHQGVYSLGGDGSRAAPFVSNEFRRQKSTIFTGSSSGGFYAIEVDKSTPSYSISLGAVDSTVNPSQSSPKRAKDGTLYLADSFGNVMAFEYTPSTGTLKQLASYPLGEHVTGAIALYDVDPTSPKEEVLVATSQGTLYVLDHTLTAELWKNTAGRSYGDEYYAGVTVAERGPNDPVALLPIGAKTTPVWSLKSGLLRAINLNTQSVEWELRPSETTPGEDKLLGSVSVLHGFETTGSDPGTIDPDPGSGIDPGIDPGGSTPGWGDIHDNPIVGSYGDIGDDVDPGDDVPPDDDTTPEPELTYLAAFASTDGHLYGVNIGTGMEVWKYALTAPGFDAPVTNRDNVVYVGDGNSVLHAVSGHTGYPFWTNSSIATTGGTNIVKLGLTLKRLIVASGTEAYSFK